ncbi:hypothetical protein A6X21_21250 [Planctopirus hydrillae]|uniref:Uncharacterized protein n=1 Tax=Planctopirus hydrillae TaxID=1841610 RepID=A0A1C3EFL7_9PLAN|nr:hypothetical protein A6X21_21250 [Planctopirus hydrillae]
MINKQHYISEQIYRIGQPWLPGVIALSAASSEFSYFVSVATMSGRNMGFGLDPGGQVEQCRVAEGVRRLL